MRWWERVEQLAQEIKRLDEYGWQPWFAWYPVRLYSTRIGKDFSGAHDVVLPVEKRVWLRWIERRLIASNGDLTAYWEYRQP